MFCQCCRPASSGFFADIATSQPDDLDAAMGRRNAYQRRKSFSDAPIMHPEPTDFMIRNACVLTMDPHIGDLPDGDIHVRDGVIVNIGHGLKSSALHEIDGRGSVTLPGFVATHRHLLSEALGGRCGPIDAADVEAMDIYRVLRLAMLDAVSAGITSLHHCGYELDPVLAEIAIMAQLDVGLHGRFSYPLGPVAADTVVPDDAAELARRWCFTPDQALLDFGLACHAEDASAIGEWGLQWPVTADHRPAAPRDLAGRTIDAARTLGLEADVGSLAPGKRADLIMVAAGSSLSPQQAMRACRDPAPAAVRLVAIDGRLRKRNGLLTEPNEGLIRREARESTAHLAAAFGWPDEHATTGVALR